jgi:hypothetical protein
MKSSCTHWPCLYRTWRRKEMYICLTTCTYLRVFEFVQISKILVQCHKKEVDLNLVRFWQVKFKNTWIISLRSSQGVNTEPVRKLMIPWYTILTNFWTPYRACYIFKMLKIYVNVCMHVQKMYTCLPNCYHNMKIPEINSTYF